MASASSGTPGPQAPIRVGRVSRARCHGLWKTDRRTSFQRAVMLAFHRRRERLHPGRKRPRGTRAVSLLRTSRFLSFLFLFFVVQSEVLGRETVSLVLPRSKGNPCGHYSRAQGRRHVWAENAHQMLRCHVIQERAAGPVALSPLVLNCMYRLNARCFRCRTPYVVQRVRRRGHVHSRIARDR